MLDYETDGITQRTMAQIANASITAVNRYISAHNISPIDRAAQRYYKYSIENVRNIVGALFTNEKKNIKNKRHAFYNFKGGTGKTSICFQVSSHVAMMGYNVLVIDADPQAHLSSSFGFLNDNDCLTLFDCLVGKRDISSIIHNIYPGLDCIPSNLSLTRLESELNQMPKREERIKFELSSIEDKYDFVFIDTNPTISILNRNIITYSDIINIICETQPYSLNGLKLLIEDLNQFSYYMQMKSKILNIIPNKYEDRSNNSAEAMSALKTYYSSYLREDFAIRKSEDIITSSKIAKPLAFFAKKNSIALEDIIELVHYLIEISLEGNKP